MKFHPAALIPPPLTDEDYSALKADIATHGLLHPIRVFDGMILDGRHRFRACDELGIAPTFEQYAGPLTPLAYVIANTRHRHMSSGQKAVMALDIERYEAEEAKKRKGARTDMVERIPPCEATAYFNDEDFGKARDKAAKAVGVNPRYVSDAKKLEREAPALLERVKTGELSLPAAKAQARDDAHRAELQRAVTFDLPAGLHVGDFREKASVLADECAELVFTDPPYDRESIPLFGDAAALAARVLKPGGSFLAYCGQTQLPEALAECAKHLRYWWCAAALDPGSQQRMNRYGVICQWKPLLWFVKGTRGDVQNFVIDIVEGAKNKGSHVWQQAEEEAAYYIEHLTSNGGLVLDFFAGGGTTLAAAARLGRPAIGFEVNPAHAAKAAERLRAA